MSYAQKLKAINDRKQKLLAEESKLIDQRKKEIGALAEKLGLLDCSDEDLIATLQSLKKSPAGKSEKVQNWENEGGQTNANSPKA